MNISVLTIFPELFNNFWESGIIKRAINMGKVTYSVSSIRDFSSGRHRTTDDRPFGGGCGMIMKPDPIVAAIRAAKKKNAFIQCYSFITTRKKVRSVYGF